MPDDQDRFARWGANDALDLVHREVGSELGPYTNAQMKQLAASGQLTAGDFVRREDKLAPIVAGKVEGLSPDAQPADRPKTTPPPLPSERGKATPPPLPSERAKTGTEDSPTPPPRSSRAAVDVLRKTVADLTETTRAAGHLAVAEARKAKLTKLTLPAAYLALGRDIHPSGSFDRSSRTSCRDRPHPSGDRPPHQPRGHAGRNIH